MSIRKPQFKPNFQAAKDFLSSRDWRRIGNNTTLERRYFGKNRNLALAVRLYGTDVVTYFPNGDIKVSTGGYATNTTITRINSFSPFAMNATPNYGYAILVFKKNDDWQSATRFAFYDGCYIRKDGTSTCEPWEDHVARIKAYNKDGLLLNNHVKRIVTALFSRKLVENDISIKEAYEQKVPDRGILDHLSNLSDIAKNCMLALEDKANQKWLSADNEIIAKRELSKAVGDLLLEHMPIILNIPRWTKKDLYDDLR